MEPCYFCPRPGVEVLKTEKERSAVCAEHVSLEEVEPCDECKQLWLREDLEHVQGFMDQDLCPVCREDAPEPKRDPEAGLSSVELYRRRGR